MIEFLANCFRLVFVALLIVADLIHLRAAPMSSSGGDFVLDASILYGGGEKSTGLDYTLSGVIVPVTTPTLSAGGDFGLGEGWVEWLVVAAGDLQLKLGFVDGNTTLKWSNESSAVVLETTSSLNQPIQWNRVNASGGTYQIQRDSSASHFFRLRKP